VLRFGPDILMPRELGRPKMGNKTSPFIEQRVIAFALGHPGFGPMRSRRSYGGPSGAGSCSPPNGGAPRASSSRLNTRAKRLGLVAGFAATTEPAPRPPRSGAAPASVPAWGDGPDGTASSSGGSPGPRARCGSTRRSTSPQPPAGRSCALPPNPSARWTSELSRRVAANLASRAGRRRR